MERGRLLVFSLAASVAYTLAYYFNWALLVYYPAVNELHLSRQGGVDGIPILWYGWLGTAVIAGVIASTVVPRRWLRRLSFDLSWIIAVVMIVAALTYEKRWF